MLFPLQTAFMYSFSNSLPFNLILLRIINIFVGVVLITLLYLFIYQYLPKASRKINYNLVLITLTISPWINNLITYHLDASLTLIFILSALLLLLKHKTNIFKNKSLMAVFSVLLLLASLSSYEGLIFSICLNSF